MKQFKFLSYLLVAVLCVGFASCSSDHDDPTVEDLVGKWQLVHEKGWEIYEGEKDEWDEDVTDEKVFHTFKEDGTGTYAEGSWRISITWQLKGNKLTIWEDDYPDDPETCIVASFSADRMVLVRQGKDYYEEDTHVRVD